jgi:hypothetical protein
MHPTERSDPGSPLRNSLWNLLYRAVSSTDLSRTAWTSILRGSCLSFFKVPVDDLPEGDNEASRREFKRLFFRLPDHRVYDLLEFMLADDRAGLKEMDRKLIRRRLNPVLDEEKAPVRLLRDRFVPLPDDLGLDAVASAQEGLTLFDLAASARHLEAAVAFLSRRPEPAGREAVREAVLAVAGVVHGLRGQGAAGAHRGGPVAVGTVAPAAEVFGMPADLAAGIDALLKRCHAVSGLPGGSDPAGSVGPPEAAFLVVFCASVVRYLLTAFGGKTE